MSLPTMHSYNTRFAAMNRSFASYVSHDDDEYVTDLGNWSPDTARRPVTRSMTATSSAPVSRVVSRVAQAQSAPAQRHQMTLRSSRR
jgi:hypothetical protein